MDTQGYVHLDTNRYSVPERLLGKDVVVHKRMNRVLIFHGQRLVADHARLIGQRDTDQLNKAHHDTLIRGHTPKGLRPRSRHCRVVIPVWIAMWWR